MAYIYTSALQAARKPKAKQNGKRNRNPDPVQTNQLTNARATPPLAAPTAWVCFYEKFGVILRRRVVCGIRYILRMVLFFTTLCNIFMARAF
jgi:hypothetical protein